MREFSTLVLDLDGVVSWRIPAQKAGVPFLGHPKNPEELLKPVPILPIDRESVDGKISTKVIYDAIRHTLAPVFPDVARVIKGLDGKFIYGNTGRLNNEPMIASTFLSLSWAKIFSNFYDIYFRPGGYTTVESKVAAIADIRRRFYENEILVADDNPQDLIQEAVTFPNITFLLIRDLTTKRLTRGIDLKSLPNVHPVSTLRAGLFG